MARAKKSVKKVAKPTKRAVAAKASTSKVKKTSRQIHEMIDTKTADLVSKPAMMLKDPKVQNFWKTPSFYIGVVVLVLLGLLLLNKSWWLAAMVNGKPIFRWDLNKTMTARFGQQTLEGMISEQLIADEAKKQGVNVTQKEIDAKVAEIVKGLGQGVGIDDLLKYQGMTKPDFEKQLRMQMMVERILGKDVTVSDVEVSDFIASNSATMTATDEGAMKAEARAAVKNQKVSEKLQQWFADLKAKSKILRFL
jgi:hypothetical protein